MAYSIARINVNLFRGRRPLVSEIAALKKNCGIQVLIDLEGDAPEACAQEMLEAKRQGMLWIKKGMGSVLPPTQKELSETFGIILYQALKHGVLFHCKYGVDRTGIMAAYYRIKQQGWSLETAWQECLNFGFHLIPYFFWKSALIGIKHD